MFDLSEMRPSAKEFLSSYVTYCRTYPEPLQVIVKWELSWGVFACLQAWVRVFLLWSSCSTCSPVRENQRSVLPLSLARWSAFEIQLAIGGTLMVLLRRHEWRPLFQMRTVYSPQRFPNWLWIVLGKQRCHRLHIMRISSSSSKIMFSYFRPHLGHLEQHMTAMSGCSVIASPCTK